MARIVVCGGSIVGLATAMMLAGDGHEVSVLEADPDGAPAAPVQAWTSWKRKGVAQFHQPHVLLSRFRQVCEQELPGMVGRLLAAGCVRQNRAAGLPPTISDTAPRPGDERFELVTGRRPVVESVFANAAQEQSGVSVRRGVSVAGLLTGGSAVAGIPHVTGVVTADGERIAADLVVDAMGRRTPSAGWLAAAGAAEPPAEGSDAGFVYYTRFLTGPTLPQLRGPGLMPLGSVSALTLPSDNDTWSVTFFGPTRDAPLKALRDPACFDRVVRACPLQAHWLDGTPISDVVAMAGILDRCRRFVVDGRPVVTGFAAVGDAWACTNPSAGRGLSVGLVHAQLLRGVVRDHLDDPATFGKAWDERTEQVAAPFFHNQMAADRARLAQMEALRNGLEPPPPDPTTARFLAAAGYDADVFRALLDTVLCLAQPEEVLARPQIRAAIEAAGDARPAPFPGPNRRQLLDLLAA